MITTARRVVVLALFALLLLLRAAPLAAQAALPSRRRRIRPCSTTPARSSATRASGHARAGTTTPIATYGDATGTVNTNPIRTDPAGRFTAYLVPGTGYSFTYERPCTPPAHGVVLKTADNISAPLVPAVTSGTWLPSLGGTATYTARTGSYVRVGALVVAIGSFTVGTLGTGSPVVVSGVPFTPTAITPVVLAPFSNVGVQPDRVARRVSRDRQEHLFQQRGGGGGHARANAGLRRRHRDLSQRDVSHG